MCKIYFLIMALTMYSQSVLFITFDTQCYQFIFFQIFRNLFSFKKSCLSFPFSMFLKRRVQSNYYLFQDVCVVKSVVFYSFTLVLKNMTQPFLTLLKIIHSSKTLKINVLVFLYLNSSIFMKTSILSGFLFFTETSLFNKISLSAMSLTTLMF